MKREEREEQGCAMKRPRGHTDRGETVNAKQARQRHDGTDTAQVGGGHSMHEEVHSRAGLDASILEVLNVASRLRVESVYCVNSRCSWDVVEIGPKGERLGPTFKVFAARTSNGNTVHRLQHCNSAESKLDQSAIQCSTSQPEVSQSSTSQPEVSHFRERHPNAFALACSFAISSARPTVVRDLCYMQASFLSGDPVHIGAGQEDASESASEKMRKALPHNASVNKCLEISSLCLTASGVHGVVIERKAVVLKDGGVLEKRRRHGRAEAVVLKDDGVVEKRRRHVSVSVHFGEDGAAQLEVRVDGQPNPPEELLWSSFPPLALISQAIAHREHHAVVMLAEVSNGLAELPKQQQIDVLLQVALRGDALTQLVDLLGVGESERGGLCVRVSTDAAHVRRLTLASAMHVSERLEASAALLEGQYVRAAVRGRGAAGSGWGEGAHLVAMRCVEGRLDLRGTHCDHAAADGHALLLSPCACAAAERVCSSGGRVLDAEKLRGLLERESSGSLVELALQLVHGSALCPAPALAELVSKGQQALRPELRGAARPLPALLLVHGAVFQSATQSRYPCYRDDRSEAGSEESAGMSSSEFAAPQPTLGELKGKVAELAGCSGSLEARAGEALALQLAVTLITAALRGREGLPSWTSSCWARASDPAAELAGLLDLVGQEGAAPVAEHRLAHAVLAEQLRQEWCDPMATGGRGTDAFWALQSELSDGNREADTVPSVLRLLEQRGMALVQAVVVSVSSSQSLIRHFLCRDTTAPAAWERARRHLAAVVPGVSLSADTPPKLSMLPPSAQTPAAVELDRLPAQPAEFVATLTATLRLFYSGPRLVGVPRLLLARGWRDAAGEAMVQALRGYLRAGEGGWPGCDRGLPSTLRKQVHTDRWRGHEKENEGTPAGALFGAALAWCDDERAGASSVEELQLAVAQHLPVLAVPLTRAPVRSAVLGLLTHPRGGLTRSAALERVVAAARRSRSPAPLGLLALELSPAALEPVCQLMLAALGAMGVHVTEASLVARCADRLQEFVWVGVEALCHALVAGGAHQMACRLSELWCEALPRHGGGAVRQAPLADADEELESALRALEGELQSRGSRESSWCDAYTAWLRKCYSRANGGWERGAEQHAVEAVVDSHVACGSEAELLRLLAEWQQRTCASVLWIQDLEQTPAPNLGLRVLYPFGLLSGEPRWNGPTPFQPDRIEQTVKEILEQESRTLSRLFKSALCVDIHLGERLLQQQIAAEHELWEQRRQRMEASFEALSRALWEQAQTLQGLPSCGAWEQWGEAHGSRVCTARQVCKTCTVGCAIVAHSLALCRLAAALSERFAHEFRGDAVGWVYRLLPEGRVNGDLAWIPGGAGAHRPEHTHQFEDLALAVAEEVMSLPSAEIAALPGLVELRELAGFDLVHDDGGDSGMEEDEDEEEEEEEEEEAEAEAAAAAAAEAAA